MKSKKGFTLVEVIVSIVLVSVVMISLLSSLIQLRRTYNLIHENSDIIVYTSSISRVINNDLSRNNGIKMITCSTDTKCEMKLGNDSNREIELLKVSKQVDSTHNNIKTTIRYLDTTNEKKPELIYIRTLELDEYEKNGVKTTKGYSFLDLNTVKKEYIPNVSSGLMDVYTTLTIRIYNGVDEENTSNNIQLYTAGRYDFSELMGRPFTIMLDDNNAQEVSDKHKIIDEVFGVGFFENGSVYQISSQLRTVEVPKYGTKAFLGYYYKENETTEEMVIDSKGNIVASNRFFKNDVNIPLSATDTSPRVYAKWGDCTNGYEVYDGECVPKKCLVKLNPDGGILPTSYDRYEVAYKALVPDIESKHLPYKDGNIFKGYYFTSVIDKYHDELGFGKKINNYYNKEDNVCELSLRADWDPCAKGTFLIAPKYKKCEKCAVGSISDVGSNKCNACQNGTTNSQTGSTSCNETCKNAANVKIWKRATWTDNTTTGLCQIDTCNDGYDLENNTCVKHQYFLVYSYRPDFNYQANEALDTKQKINWDKDFEIHAAFTIPETGKRYLIAGSYDGNSDKELNIEVTANNELRIYIGSGDIKLNKVSGKVKANANVNVVLKWNSKEKKISLTSTGDGLVSAPNLKDIYVDMSGRAANTILGGGHDHRPGNVFNKIKLTTLLYKTFHDYNSNVSLVNPTSTGRTFSKWSLSESGGTSQTSVNITGNTTVYGSWQSETVVSDSVRCGTGNVDWTINGNHAVFRYDIFLYYTFVRKADNSIYATTSIRGKIVHANGSGYFDNNTDYKYIKDKSNWVKGSVTIGNQEHNFNGIISQTIGEWWPLNNVKVANGESVKITCATAGYVPGTNEAGQTVNINSWNASGPVGDVKSYSWDIDVK